MVHPYHERTRALRQVEERRQPATFSRSRKTTSGRSCGRNRRRPSTSPRISARPARTDGRETTPAHRSCSCTAAAAPRSRGRSTSRASHGRGRRSASTPSATSVAVNRSRGRRRGRLTRSGSKRPSPVSTSNARNLVGMSYGGFLRAEPGPGAVPDRVTSLTLLDPAGLAPINLGSFIVWGMSVIEIAEIRACPLGHSIVAPADDIINLALRKERACAGRQCCEISERYDPFAPDIHQPRCGAWCTTAGQARPAPIGRIGRVVDGRSCHTHIEQAALVVHRESISSDHRARRGRLRRTLSGYQHPVWRGKARQGDESSLVAGFPLGTK